MSSMTPEALAAEFDCLLARAGVTVPADRRESILVAYADLRTHLPLLHGKRSHVVEPANVFRLTPRGDRQ